MRSPSFCAETESECDASDERDDYHHPVLGVQSLIQSCVAMTRLRWRTIVTAAFAIAAGWRQVWEYAACALTDFLCLWSLASL